MLLVLLEHIGGSLGQHGQGITGEGGGGGITGDSIRGIEGIRKFLQG